MVIEKNITPEKDEFFENTEIVHYYIKAMVQNVSRLHVHGPGAR